MVSPWHTTKQGCFDKAWRLTPILSRFHSRWDSWVNRCNAPKPFFKFLNLLQVLTNYQVYMTGSSFGSHWSMDWCILCVWKSQETFWTKEKVCKEKKRGRRQLKILRFSWVLNSWCQKNCTKVIRQGCITGLLQLVFYDNCDQSTFLLAWLIRWRLQAQQTETQSMVPTGHH